MLIKNNNIKIIEEFAMAKEFKPMLVIYYMYKNKKFTNELRSKNYKKQEDYYWKQIFQHNQLKILLQNKKKYYQVIKNETNEMIKKVHLEILQSIS